MNLFVSYQIVVPEDENKEVHYYPVMLRREESVSSYSGNYYRRSLFSQPFILSVTEPSKLTYSQLYELLYQRIRRFLKSVPTEKVVRTTDDLDDKEQTPEKDEKMNTSDSDEEPVQVFTVFEFPYLIRRNERLIHSLLSSLRILME